MYNDEILRTPSDIDDFWKLVDEHFSFVIGEVFQGFPFETKEQALEGTYRKNEQGKISKKQMSAVRYRNVSFEIDNRKHFYDMGHDLIPVIEAHIAKGEITPEFFHDWGKIMFCHGYIAAHIFDDSDDLVQRRSGMNSGLVRNLDSQKKWYAHQIVPLIDQGNHRSQAEDKVVKFIKNIILEEHFSEGFDKEWFSQMFRAQGSEKPSDFSVENLKATLSQKNLSAKAMRKLVKLPRDDIPLNCFNFPS